jgi:iron(III) transport system substrate-binding protein
MGGTPMLRDGMKRYVFIILFVVVLATPFAVRLGLGWHATTRSGSGAQKTVVILTPQAESIKREFAWAFSDWHRERFGETVKVDYRPMSTNDVVKYLRAGKETVYAKLGTYNVDLVWGGGDYVYDGEHRDSLKKLNVLEPVQLDDAIMRAAYPQSELGGLPLYDRASPPTWFGAALSSFGIVFNKDVLEHLGLPEPKTWADLRDPRYRGWIVLVDPTRSGVAQSVFMVMVEHAMAQAKARGESEDKGWSHGMGQIRLIAANARLFNDSSTAVAGWVSSGDVAAGCAIDYHARSQIDAVGEARMGYVEPVGATAVSPEPVAMVRGAPNRQIAKRFIEFLLSERGQRLWNTRAGTAGGPRQTSLRRLPIMRSVYDHPTDFTDKVNPFAAAAGFNTSAARRGTLPIVGDLIESSCMEPLAELRETRKSILASPERDVLERSLGDFPFDQTRAIEMAQRWSKMTALQRLAAQRELTESFRAEYAELKEAAERKHPNVRR